MVLPTLALLGIALPTMGADESQYNAKLFTREYYNNSVKQTLNINCINESKFDAMTEEQKVGVIYLQLANYPTAQGTTGKSFGDSLFKDIDVYRWDITETAKTWENWKASGNLLSAKYGIIVLDKYNTNQTRQLDGRALPNQVYDPIQNKWNLYGYDAVYTHYWDYNSLPIPRYNGDDAQTETPYFLGMSKNRIRIDWVANGAEDETPSNRPIRFKLTLDRAISYPVDVGLNLTGKATPGIDYYKVVDGQSMMPNFVTIPAGKRSQTFSFAVPVDGAPIEGTEDVVIGINSSNQFDVRSEASKTTLYIDNLQRTIRIDKIGDALEGNKKNPAVFKITVSPVAYNQNVSIPITLSGSAIAGKDFPGFTSVTLPANSKEGIININSLMNELDQSDKSLTLSLSPNAAYNPDPSARTASANIRNQLKDYGVSSNSYPSPGSPLPTNEGLSFYVEGAPTANNRLLYRMILANGSHFYTIDKNERDFVLSAGGTDEKTPDQYIRITSAPGYSALYRYRLKADGNIHAYLFDVNEVNTLNLPNSAWFNEGRVGYVRPFNTTTGSKATDKAVFRMREKDNGFFLTASLDEVYQVANLNANEQNTYLTNTIGFWASRLKNNIYSLRLRVFKTNRDQITTVSDGEATTLVNLGWEEQSEIGYIKPIGSQPKGTSETALYRMINALGDHAVATDETLRTFLNKGYKVEGNAFGYAIKGSQTSLPGIIGFLPVFENWRPVSP